MESGDRPIRQHYVPRLLLRQFAVEEQLDAFDLRETVPFQTAVSNAAVEKRFYDFRVGRSVVSPETWLEQIETAAAPTLQKLAKDPRSIELLSPAEEIAFARFVVAQDARGPHSLELVDFVRSHMVTHAKEITRCELVRDLGQESADLVWRQVFEDEPDERWLNEDEPYQQGEGLAVMLGEVDGLSNVLRAMPWRAGRVPASVHLYTCDNPVARGSAPQFRWPVFFQHRHFLALSPRVLVIFGPGVGESDVGSRTRRDFNAWAAVLANVRTTASASRYLYGPGPYVGRDGLVLSPGVAKTR